MLLIENSYIFTGNLCLLIKLSYFNNIKIFFLINMTYNRYKLFCYHSCLILMMTKTYEVRTTQQSLLIVNFCKFGKMYN